MDSFSGKVAVTKSKKNKKNRQLHVQPVQAELQLHRRRVHLERQELPPLQVPKL
jgi:hypothetical protein